MTPHDLDDEFLVWPFRRQLVDETALSDERTVHLVRRAPVLPAPPPAPPRRRALSPLRVAGPVGATVFVLAAAGAAALGGADDSTRLGAAPVAAAVTPALRTHTRVQRDPLFVPDVRGLKLKTALRHLRARRFRPVLRYRSGAKPGLVLSQRPAAAAPVRRPGRVVVTVGRAVPKPKPRPVAPPLPAPRTAIVASVVGLDRRTAAEALLAEGYGVRIYGVPSPAPVGRVVAQSPRPGTTLAAGAYVRVNVSAG